MTLTRPRLTVRRLMIAVAVVAVIAWAGKMLWLSAAYQQRARAYLSSIPPYIYWGPGPIEPPRTPHNLWAHEMADKYWRAARYPFLPVPSDPPEPE